MKKTIIALLIKYCCHMLEKTNKNAEKMLTEGVALTDKRYIKLEKKMLCNKARLIFLCSKIRKNNSACC